MSWHLREQLRTILAGEQGAKVYAPGSRGGFALIYPNTYHVGMSNLGLHIIYQQINSRGDTACERLFLPDKKWQAEYARTNTPLMTIENQLPLYEFPLLGFAVSFEMDYFNILKILELGRVPVWAGQRSEQDPIVIAGGPCATFNPEPVADFFDAFIIGEGEEVIHEFLDTYYAGKSRGLSRSQILADLANVDGIYVPRFYEPQYDTSGAVMGMNRQPGIPAEIKRRWVRDLDRYQGQSVIITDHTEFKNMYLIEVARGCGRHCRFCMAGYCFRRPRTRSLECIEAAVMRAKEFRAKVGLMGAAISDYPEIDKLCESIISKNMWLSVASLRADSLTSNLVAALARSGHKTVTFAPEAGSERMRHIINKTITDRHLHTSVEGAVKAGIPNIRLYIMIGLPFEETADITAIVSMAVGVKHLMENLGSRGKLTLSVNPFIPKPFTPFQWVPMAPAAEIEGKYKYLQGALRREKGIELLLESTKDSYIQAILARGDRRLAAALYTAHQLGGSKYFRKAMKVHGLPEGFYLAGRPANILLPWQHLNMGLKETYLSQELKNASDGKITAPCADGCLKCGVCLEREV